MATLISKANGNFTAATTWALADSTSLLDSEINQGPTSVVFTSSQTFTPGTVTIDGIGLKVVSRTASPTGTFSVRLAIAGVAVTGTTVTVNAADLQVAQNGWAFFKFTASIMTVGATAYTVQTQSSVASTVTIYRDATASNWSRFLRTTTTQAPAAGDNLNICGEYTGAGTSNALTVTMNNTTATVFGKIETSGKGTLSCGTSASTNYQLITGGATGNFYVNGDGVVQWGTSGTPIPSTSNITQTLTQNGLAVTNGILLRGNGNFTTFGSSKTQKAFLNADANATATTITTDISTGWKSGDLIAVASTTKTPGESEIVNLSADAIGTSVSISALTNTHSGTSPTKGEVANLTRNIKIQGETTAFTSYINAATGTTFNFNNTEVYFMGSATNGKRGVDIATDSTGSFRVDGCVWRDFTNSTNFGFLANSATNANISITNTNLYNITSNGLALLAAGTASTVTINNILAIGSACIFNFQAATMTNITVVGGI